MLTPHCSAVSGMVAPSSIAPTTRTRKSSEYGFAIHAGLLPVGSLNHIRARRGIPLRFSLSGKRSKRLARMILVKAPLRDILVGIVTDALDIGEFAKNLTVGW